MRTLRVSLLFTIAVSAVLAYATRIGDWFALGVVAWIVLLVWEGAVEES